MDRVYSQPASAQSQSSSEFDLPVRAAIEAVRTESDTAAAAARMSASASAIGQAVGRAESHAAGHAAGHAQGVRQGHAEGVAAQLDVQHAAVAATRIAAQALGRAAGFEAGRAQGLADGHAEMVAAQPLAAEIAVGAQAVAAQPIPAAAGPLAAGAAHLPARATLAGRAQWALGLQRAAHPAELQAASARAQFASFLRDKPRQLLALGGHLVHQTVSVGVPTFAREMIAPAVAKAIESNPAAIGGAQAALVAAKFLGQLVRIARERRDPEVAARGFHGMSPRNWEAAVGTPGHRTQDQQNALRALVSRQQAHSYLVAVYQASAVVADVSMTIYGAATGQPDISAENIGRQVKDAFYVTARDLAQASFQMVGIEGGHGQTPAALDAAAGTYFGLTFSGAVTANAAERGLDARARQHASAVGAPDPGSATAPAWQTALARAAINALVETSDYMQLTSREAQLVGGQQRLATSTPRDYGRLLDQTPGRDALVGASSSAAAVIDRAFRHTSVAQSLSSGLAGSAITALAYLSVVPNWFAAGAIRETHLPSASVVPPMITQHAPVGAAMGPERV